VQNKDEDAIQVLCRSIARLAWLPTRHVVAAVVDRTMDIIETVFLKEGRIGQSSGAERDGSATSLTVRAAASAAAAGLRMLDGVRMSGPSLAKLCDMPLEDEKGDEVKARACFSNMSVASTLCIAIHRTTVQKLCKNLGKSGQGDSGRSKQWPRRPALLDCRLATVTSDVVRAIRLISPFVSAYKSVTKRRSLAWDPNVGDEAGEMDSSVTFPDYALNSLQGKALNYTKNSDDEGGHAKSNMFMINNTFYLLQQLSPKDTKDVTDVEVYQLDGVWFQGRLILFSNRRGQISCRLGTYQLAFDLG
jgi:exocyst complex protein 7